MPKLFPIHIEVEELAVGKVMRLLNNTPGIAKMNLDLEKKEAKANGLAVEKRAYQPRNTYEVTGADLVLQALFKRKRVSRNDLTRAFVTAGRSPTSINSVLHELRKKGEITLNGNDYLLTKKSRDRLRYNKRDKK